jgi:hypothetical protein
MKFAVFAEPDGSIIYVNPDKVVMVRRSRPYEPDSTVIVTENDSITVTAVVLDVIRSLREEEI